MPIQELVRCDSIVAPKTPPPAFATISASSGHSRTSWKNRINRLGNGRERGKVAATDAGHHQSPCTTAPSCSAWRSWIPAKGHRKDRALRSPRALRRARLHRASAPGILKGLAECRHSFRQNTKSAGFPPICRPTVLPPVSVFPGVLLRPRSPSPNLELIRSHGA
jgi:hypothetical protein